MLSGCMCHFQNAARLPVNFDEGIYRVGNIELPRLDVVAAKGKDDHIYVSITNIDPNNTASLELSLDGHILVSVDGETLHAPSIDAVNTFEDPDNVSTKVINATVSGSKISLSVLPQSLTVLTIAVKE
jgi:alpha-L-arabinofuranosidase